MPKHECNRCKFAPVKMVLGSLCAALRLSQIPREIAAAKANPFIAKGSERARGGGEESVANG